MRQTDVDAIQRVIDEIAEWRSDLLDQIATLRQSSNLKGTRSNI